MDSNLILIFGFILIITALTITLGGAIHKRDLQFKQRKLELEANKGSGMAPEAAQKIEKLEKRVRVLERLATDRGQDLALQIEELRKNSADTLEFDAREKTQ